MRREEDSRLEDIKSRMLSISEDDDNAKSVIRDEVELGDPFMNDNLGLLSDSSSFELTEIPKDSGGPKEMDINKLMEERANSLKELGIS